MCGGGGVEVECRGRVVGEERSGFWGGREGMQDRLRGIEKRYKR